MSLVIYSVEVNDELCVWLNAERTTMPNFLQDNWKCTQKMKLYDVKVTSRNNSTKAAENNWCYVQNYSKYKMLFLLLQW